MRMCVFRNCGLRTDLAHRHLVVATLTEVPKRVSTHEVVSAAVVDAPLAVYLALVTWPARETDTCMAA